MDKSQAMSASGLFLAISAFIKLYHKSKRTRTKEAEKKRIEESKETTTKRPQQPLQPLRRTDSLRHYDLERESCDQLGIEKVEHLSEWVERPEGKQAKFIVSPLLRSSEKKGKAKDIYTGDKYLPENSFVKPGAFLPGERFYNDLEELQQCTKYMKAGPRKYLYFSPDEVTAAIVTCGGLCPGLNVVIRELVMTLWYNYGVRKIWGVKWGYQGIYGDEEYWQRLTPEYVRDIHQLGGTVLGSSRGGFEVEQIDQAIKCMERRGINHMYCVGGDGTHRGIKAMAERLRKLKYRISLVGIPKTIDNDICVIDKTFGFDSAVEAAQAAIESGNVEANSALFGVGLVKLMGRDAGHIAMHASLANRDVNVCLVPEFKFDLYGKFGLLEYICTRLKRKNHIVLVTGEGAGVAIRDHKLTSVVRDPSGNIKPPDIGGFLKKEIVDYGKEKHNMEITLKYIDPTYMIRTVKANSADKKLCSYLYIYIYI